MPDTSKLKNIYIYIHIYTYIYTYIIHIQYIQYVYNTYTIYTYIYYTHTHTHTQDSKIFLEKSSNLEKDEHLMLSGFTHKPGDFFGICIHQKLLN